MTVAPKGRDKTRCLTGPEWVVYCPVPLETYPLFLLTQGSSPQSPGGTGEKAQCILLELGQPEPSNSEVTSKCTGTICSSMIPSVPATPTATPSPPALPGPTTLQAEPTSQAQEKLNVKLICQP